MSHKIGNILLGLICILYILNPTAGVIELIPDTVPLIGNLDEAAAVTGLLIALRNLGIINPGKKPSDFEERYPN